MLHFSCMYCGQEIRTEALLIGQKVTCPACGHAMRVPPKADAATEKPTPEPGSGGPQRDPAWWRGRSNRQIVEWLAAKRPTKEEREKRAYRRLLARSFARYDDLTLFALSATLVLLLLINSEVRSALPRAVVKWPTLMLDMRIMAILTGASAGMVLSFFNVFFRRKKFEAEKWLMLLFAVLVTAGTGAYAGYVTLRWSPGWLMIFPIWNVVNGGILLIEFRAGLVNTDCIVDKKPSAFQVMLTLLSIAILLILCHHVFALHWAITYSICVCYTMSLHQAVQDVLRRRTPTA